MQFLHILTYTCTWNARGTSPIECVVRLINVFQRTRVTSFQLSNVPNIPSSTTAICTANLLQATHSPSFLCCLALGQFPNQIKPPSTSMRPHQSLPRYCKTQLCSRFNITLYAICKCRNIQNVHAVRDDLPLYRLCNSVIHKCIRTISETTDGTFQPSKLCSFAPLTKIKH
jgi:hypothetical protein